VWKAYAIGFLSAALAVVLATAIWFGSQPREASGLLWGDTVYTSKQEFNGYLKSKGLSYQTWVARNPGVAPWEPDEITIGAITTRAPTTALDRPLVRLLLAAGGLILAAGCALLLLHGRSPGPIGSLAVFGAVLAVLAGAIWFSTQPSEQPGLLWRGTVYTSKQDFQAYLRSNGLSYETWVARHPGAAPWESAMVRVSAKAPAATKAHEDSAVRPLLPVIGVILAACGALLLFRRRRLVTARFATEAVAFDSSGPLRVDTTSTGPATFGSIRRLGVVVSEATDHLKVSVPLYGGRLVGAARADARLLGQRMRKRDISMGDVAYALLAVMCAVVFALIVVFVLSP
jgi:hypothetical protein